jgi:NADH-quinone oxidoreductase subunit N
MMLLVMFSMTGIPPMVGFYAKLAVLQSVLNAGFLGLAVTAVLFSVVGAFYYLRVVKLMYFDAPDDTAILAPTADVKVLMSLNGAALLFFGIVPQPLMAICLYSIQASL